jgi:hypothetical protein
MTLTLDQEQAQILREILSGQLNQLRIESARTDAHDFRVALHRREGVVEQLLAQLSEPAVARVG